ncbi:branched-chain amino acid aminotransferase [Chryseomicrobium sp. FSL W7-1435]|uniref:branched-chain amino acid aminotransferase n=1 Tax=Chryseomicrobium sp. FSL W7-1435 TaxID=2921704 RepID=UPI00315AE51A
MPVQVEKSISHEKKSKTPDQQLVFGRTFTDHMFVADYTAGYGWHDFRIQPYQPLVLEPSAIVFHYGQTVFEGLKAYKSPTGKVRLFRPRLNFERMNESCSRMSMPEIDPDQMLESLMELLQLEKDWIPTAPGTSLYIRPFMIATEAYLGVAPSQKYQFMIILSPVGSYYKEGIAPVKILVENQYVRAVAGGTGTAKTAGNYAASLKAQETAAAEGYAQVMWLDGVERKYIEEVGSMNVFFKIDGKVYTPALNGSILDGITRRSIVDILRYWEIPVIEKRISMEEIRQAHRTGLLEEAWGTGTAAVISPIGEFKWQNELFYVNNGQTGELSARLYDTLTGIQTGELPDPFGWTIEF